MPRTTNTSRGGKRGGQIMQQRVARKGNTAILNRKITERCTKMESIISTKLCLYVSQKQLLKACIKSAAVYPHLQLLSKSVL